MIECRCGNRIAIIKMRERRDRAPPLSLSLSLSSLSRVPVSLVVPCFRRTWPLLMFLNRISRVSECLEVAAPNHSPSRTSRALGVWLDDAQKGEVNCGVLGKKKRGGKFGARC